MLRLRCLPAACHLDAALGLGARCLPRRRPAVAFQKPAGNWRLRGVAAAVTGSLSENFIEDTFSYHSSRDLYQKHRIPELTAAKVTGLAGCQAKSCLADRARPEPSRRIKEVGYITDLEAWAK